MVWLYVFFLAGQFDTTFRDGLIALNENNLPVAESRLESASQLEPRNPRVWVALAQTYWKQHKLAQAESAVHNAEKFAAGDAVVRRTIDLFYTEDYYFEIAQLHLKQQEFAAALETLEAGRKKFDRSPQLALAAGVACYGLRRFPEAIDAFLRTNELDPAIEQPYVFLGRMLDQAEGKLPRITQVFAAFAVRAPENYLSSYLYGKALALANDPGGEALLRKSIERNAAFGDAHFELGVLLEAQRKYADAAVEMRRAAELSPTDPVPHYHLAQIYARLGRPEEAAAERAQHARMAGVK
jgi:tetratricopeptide (TPR) repeat protein